MARLSRNRAALRRSILRRVRDDLRQLERETKLKRDRSTSYGMWEDQDAGLCWPDGLVRDVGAQVIADILNAPEDLEGER